MKLVALSARGFDVPVFVDEFLAIPGFAPKPKSFEIDGKRSKAGGDLPLASRISQALLRDLREHDVGISLDGRDKLEFALISATQLVAGRLNSFDFTMVWWPGSDLALVVQAFVRLCRAARAEYGYLDLEEPDANFRKPPVSPRMPYARPRFAWPIDLHYGLPAVAWLNFFGPQFLEKVPAVETATCWWRKERAEGGLLAWLCEDPAEASSRREQALDCLGPTVRYPRTERIGFDLSSKNRYTPEWLMADDPPPLPEGAEWVRPPPKGRK